MSIKNCEVDGHTIGIVISRNTSRTEGIERVFEVRGGKSEEDLGSWSEYDEFKGGIYLKGFLEREILCS
jgi:hypothetical protein